MENENKQKISTPMAILAAGFMIMIGIIISRMPAVSEDKVANDTDTKSASIVLKEVSKEDHVLGDLSKAELVIVEFSDTECPFCKSFHVALHDVVDKYEGKVAWVYRHFPLEIHPKAKLQARASECAAEIGGNDAFWKYIDLIFTTTKSNNQLDDALLPVFASQIGLDTQAFAECFASTRLDAKVAEDYNDGIKAGIRGTPGSFVITKDGTKIPILGADVANLNSVIETMLK